MASSPPQIDLAFVIQEPGYCRESGQGHCHRETIMIVILFKQKIGDMFCYPYAQELLYFSFSLVFLPVFQCSLAH